MDADEVEDWDFYFCCIDDQTAFVRLDLGLIQRAPLAGLDTLITVRIPLRLPDKDGLVRREEFDDITAVEQALSEGLIKQGACYTGCVTSGGMRELYFYACKDKEWEDCIAELMTAFPAYSYTMHFSDDPEWEEYLDFLYPSLQEMSFITNNRVRRQLEDQGDVSTSRREIDHFLYFPTRDAAQAALQKAEEAGFSPIENGIGPREDDVWVVSITRSDAVIDIDEITTWLINLATELGGEYDGWECIVCKE